MKDFFRQYWWGMALCVALIWGLFSLLEPPPPKTVTIASGSPGGAYAATAEKYKKLLEDVGVTLEVIPTSGSVDNLTMLQNGEVDIGVVQSGVATAVQKEDVQSLGAVFYEPLWVFVSGHMSLKDLRSLTGLRVAVGAEGSGAKALADVLLLENGLDTSKYTQELVGGSEAAQMLMEGRIDAALVVASPDAEWIMRLMRTPTIKLVSMDRALAYARRHPYMKDVILPDGALSLRDDLPAQDVNLIAPVAQIAVRDGLHPAIQGVLLEAMNKTHRGGALLNAPGMFPTPTLSDLGMSSEADRFYERGPSFLRRYFSFGIANFLERAWVLLIPMITLLIPIVRAGPPIYRWRIRRKIYVWYRDLRHLEAQGRIADTEEARLEIKRKLAELQAETGKVEVPDSYTDDLYRLRAHIRFVAELLDKMGANDEAAWI